LGHPKLTKPTLGVGMLAVAVVSLMPALSPQKRLSCDKGA
jgi:hypothetical protein